MIFARLYLKVMQWARSRYADYILAAVSFTESMIFPIPPDVMLMPMAMAKPERAMYLATLTTVCSVLGGIAGYGIGMWAFPTLVEPLIHQFGYTHLYETIHAWFMTWGFWVVFLAGFTPIPYKLFTVTAGMVGIAFAPFVLASFLGRGARFYLVAFLMAKGGPKLEQAIHDGIVRFGWLLVGIFIAVVVAYGFLH
ncbi:MAG: YqaA family protein [Gammaproteobacteria bacterium]